MPHSTDLHKVEPVEQTDDLFDDVAWLTSELADASSEHESDLMRLLLSRVTLNNMFQFCALLDARGTMWDVNDAALRGAGLSRRDIHGKPFWEERWWQSSPEAPRRLKEAIERAAHGEFVRYDVDIIRRASGKEIITIDFNIKPVQDRDGAVQFLICEGRDVTEQRHLEREVARQREELDEPKTQFFANVSHEFRTPLTLMLGPIEDSLADLEEPLGPRQRERTTMVLRNRLRLQKLVNALLDFSRVEAGRMQPLYQPTDLASLTHDLGSSFRSACQKAAFELVIEAPPLDEAVFVDREMWDKIVLNLISNAFKFTLEGEIRVTVCAEGDHAVLPVSDTGAGIPEAEVPLIFDRFHRVEGTRGRTHDGTGIGLALVQELVKLHKDSVAVESTLGRGTTFIVWVPFGSAHLPQARIDAARSRVSTATRADAFVSEALRWLPDSVLEEGLDVRDESHSTTPSAGAERARVLLADDNADMRDYLCRLLTERYDVENASDGQPALEAAPRDRPDLVLSDVMMPRLDGFGLLRAIRSDSDRRDVPVILLSARAGEEASVEGLEVGADDYLIKPFSARELQARVRANLDMAATRKTCDRRAVAPQRDARGSGS
jgi:PAS domain S-box-containing protein